VVQYGTGRAARQPFPIYGKTGTTDDFTNAWFSGCSKALCITVWMGYDRPYHRVNGQIVAHQLRTSYGAPVYGGTLPAQMFARIFNDYRALGGEPGLIGSPPYPTAPPVVATPRSTASPTTTPTRRRDEETPTPKATEKLAPAPTDSSTTRPLLQPRR
jgi:membrane peptidoglycan carboxypeptidase